ncbi:hypothetical protein K438DRAFT_1770655 [Mycena galopus ATCC 62051]|nr:hypothetical protein K438DRAFT_1770655 [Mycena galopus ATCC 62051]
MEQVQALDIAICYPWNKCKLWKLLSAIHGTSASSGNCYLLSMEQVQALETLLSAIHSTQVTTFKTVFLTFDPTLNMPHQPTVNEIRLRNITACLTFALPLLNELNDVFRPPFVQPISKAIKALIDSVQNVKRNKSECAQLMDNIHCILYAIVDFHMKSETVGSLHPSMLGNLGGFIETLHKIYSFVEAQQEGIKIKHLFHNNEMNKLLQDCHVGLKQAQEVFNIQTQTQALNDVNNFKKTVDLMHKELIEVIETLSDTRTVSEERSSVYIGAHGSKNSSNSFSMLPSKPKIFHGREQELNHILKWLTEQSPRMAIMGGGGMGKTSLARAVLHHPNTLAKFENRFFVSAEAATTSVQLAALIGLHVVLNPGKDLTKPVVQYFSRKVSCLLLILDNLETVWEPIQSRPDVEEFLSLLTGLEHLALMITMRGAKVHWTHPFLSPLQRLSNEAARQTFIEITDNFNQIEEMDKLLGFTDNMPLAVNIIAHLADYEGFSSVLSRWKTEKTALLSVGSDRQSSVDISIGLSLSSPRMTSCSKELLRLLSILPNGLSEAELVLFNTGIPKILSCKAALQATSLVYQDNNRRWVVLMPIREYIQQISPPAESHVQSIRQHFYALMVQYEKYCGEQQKPLVNQITLNLANLQNILQQGLHLNSQTFADTLLCTLSLDRFYGATGQDHSPLLDDIQALLPHLCDQHLETLILIEFCWSWDYWTTVSEDMVAQAIIHLDHTNNPHLGSRFYGAAAHHFFHHKAALQQATQFYHKALEMARLCGDSTQECIALIQIAIFKWNTGDYCAANAFAAEAQRLSNLSADLYLEAWAIHLGAISSISLGSYQNTPPQLYRALELLRICGLSEGPLGIDISEAQAEIHLSKSEYFEARRIFCKIIETTAAEVNSSSYAHALLNIGLIDTIIGEAEEDICDTLKVAQRTEMKDSACGFVRDMVQGILDLRAGRFDMARAKFKKSLYQSWGQSSRTKCLCLEHLADIKAWPANEWDENWLVIYLADAHNSKAKLALYKALLLLGDAFSEKNDEDTAANLYQVALAGFTQMDVHHGRAKCMLRLGDLAIKHENPSEAITFWKAAQPLFQQSVPRDVAQIDSRLTATEGACQEALGKLETLHASIQMRKEMSETEAQDPVEEDANEHRAILTM